MKAAILTGAGRPLRVLVLMAFAGVVWLATRVPDVRARYDAVVAAMVRPVQDPPVVVARSGLPAVVAVVRSPMPLVPQPAFRQAPRAAPVLVAAAPAAPARIEPLWFVDDSPPMPVVPQPTAPVRSSLPTPAVAGFDLATAAYSRLAVADRRGADRLFTAALAAADGHDVPQAADWRRAQRQLRRRWSGDAYGFLRDTGLAGPVASPVLGGGQSGGSLAYSLDPLARRPLVVFGRLYVAHDAAASLDPATAQAAIGVRWQLRPGLSLAAERLIAIGAATSGDWNLRLAAGGERRFGTVTFDGYGEAGVRGNGDVYAGGEAHARVPIGTIGAVQLAAGPGLWGSVQAAGTPVGRLDLGAGVAARLPAGVSISGDWRWRVAGNAAPGSGPAITVATTF